MASETSMRRYRNWYAKLLRFYPKPYHERFGESMHQTFNDLCRERRAAGKGIFGFVIWMFAETSGGIIRENITSIVMQKSLVRVAIVVGLILLVPLFGNLYVNGWNWSFSDFIVAGVMLFSAGMTYELVVKRMDNKAYRFAVGLAVVTALALTWVTLAVEIIGGDNPANLMYGGVIAIGIVGAALARLEPRGMGRVLLAMALAQMLVPAIALIFWRTNFAPGVAKVFALNGVFAMLFVGSALLFRRASASRV